MRYILAIGLLLVVVGGLVGVKGLQFSTMIAMGKEMEKMGPPPEAVATAVAQEQLWEDGLSAVGSVGTIQGVTIGADASGIVTRLLFDSGAKVAQGEVLLELDARLERAQLASAQARRELADANVVRTRALYASGSVAQAELDADETALKTVSTECDALQAQIDKKTVRAPFAGRIGLRLVNLGQYLSSGAPIAVLNGDNTLYVDFSLPQQRTDDVHIGMSVRLSIASEPDRPIMAKVAAVEPMLDAMTRTLKVRAALAKETGLRPGMFVQAFVILPDPRKVVAVPVTAIVHASYGDSLFVIENRKDEKGGEMRGSDGNPLKMARQQFVRLGRTKGDYVAIDDGVQPGQEIAVAGSFKLRNGSSVTVKNEVLPNIQTSPKVDER